MKDDDTLRGPVLARNLDRSGSLNKAQRPTGLNTHWPLFFVLNQEHASEVVETGEG